MTAPDRWPRSRRWMSRGVGCAAVRVSPCQERVTTAWLCVLHQQKNNVSTAVSTMVWGMVVLSPYFSYFCLPVVCLSSLSWVTTGVKLIRVFTGGSTQKLALQARCCQFVNVHTVHAVNVTLTKVCLSHIYEITSWRHSKYLFIQTGGQIKICLPC